MNPAYHPATNEHPVGIHFQEIEKQYGSLFALRKVSLNIQPGEMVALLGANGSGKSTLLRVAAGLVHPTSGTLTFEKASNAGISTTETIQDAIKLRRMVAMVGHNIMLYDELTAEENLSLVAELYDLSNRRTRIREALASAGLALRSGSLTRTFSRGMRQRLAIARALLSSPALLLLDEPTTGLDVQGMTWFTATLRNLRAQGCTIVMSTHGRSEALALATRAIRLEAGRLVADSAVGSNLAAMLTFEEN